MNRFPKDARVCFVGDSITAVVDWTAKVFEYYATHLPEDRVMMYNCGISGDTSTAALRRVEPDVLCHKPTHIVMMFGMNDVGIWLYNADADEARIARRAERLATYAASMEKMIVQFRNAGLPVTLVTPTPYDDLSTCATVSYVNIQPAFEAMRDTVYRLGAQYGCEVVDFYRPMYAIIAEQIKTVPEPKVVGGDRVHPCPMGASVMARLFLRAQGFSDVAAPTAETVISGEAAMPVTGPNAERWKTEAVVHRVRWFEWNLSWGQFDMQSDAERCAYWQERYKTMNEQSTAPLMSQVELYLANKPCLAELEALLVRRTEMMYPMDGYRPYNN